MNTKAGIAMETALYALIDVICMFMLALLIKHLRKRSAPMPDEVSFKRLMYATLVTLLCDLLNCLVTDQPGAFSHTLQNISNVIYFALTGVIGLLWLQYVDYKTHEDLHGLRSRTRLYCIPALALIVLAVGSPWSRWLFYIDENNHYIRGGIFFSQVVLGFAYIGYSSFLALKSAAHQTKPAEKREKYLLASFIILPLIGGIVQAIWYGLPTLWTGTTLSILVVFINLQNRLLAMDSLTGVNSRVQMERYILGLTEEKSDKSLSMLLLDVGEFKQLNDEYGHVTADNVLKTVSAILRKVCDNRNDFVARFGGDEFAVICSDKDNDYLTGLSTAILREVEHYNQISHNPFRIRLGVGKAILGEVKDDDVDGMISRATQQIEQQKLAVSESGAEK